MIKTLSKIILEKRVKELEASAINAEVQRLGQDEIDRRFNEYYNELKKLNNLKRGF